MTVRRALFLSLIFAVACLTMIGISAQGGGAAPAQGGGGRRGGDRRRLTTDAGAAGCAPQNSSRGYAPGEALQEIGVRLDATSVRYALNAGTSPDSAPRIIMAIGVSQSAGSSFNASSTTPVCARTM